MGIYGLTYALYHPRGDSDRAMITKHSIVFFVHNPGALFRKSMLLDRDCLNSAPGLCMEDSMTMVAGQAKFIRSRLG